MSLPFTPNNFWGFKKRNIQEKLHHPVLCRLGKITQSFTPKYSQGIRWRNEFHLGYHSGQNSYKHLKIVSKTNCLGTIKFVKITKQSLYKAKSFACSLANRDKPAAAATLQRKCSRGIICSKELYCNQFGQDGTPENSWGINCVILEGPIMVIISNGMVPCDAHGHRQHTSLLIKQPQKGG